MSSDPMGTIEWLFASNQALGINYVPRNRMEDARKNYLENNFQIRWESISAIASYSFLKVTYHHHTALNSNAASFQNQRHEKNDSFIKLALSKYQIYEIHSNSRMDSVLTIKVNGNVFKKLTSNKIL